MAKGKTVLSVSGHDIVFNGEEFGIYEGNKHKARAFTDGTFGKPLAGGSIRTESIPAEIRAAVKTAMQRVNEQFVAARDEMFPNFKNLDAYARRLARLDIMKRLGYMSELDAHCARTAEVVIEARAQEMDRDERNEEARRRFDNE